MVAEADEAVVVMRARLPLGRYHGVPVHVGPSILLVMVLLTEILAVGLLPAAVPGRPPAAYLATAGVTALLFVAGVVAHELAHAAAARRHGVGVRGITIGAFGGATELDGRPPTPRADLAVAASGPLASLGVAAVALVGGLLARGAGADLAAAGLSWLAAMNAVLAAVNLLPGAPLDGAHVARALIWWRTGDRRRAALLADRVGQSLGGGLIALGAMLLLTTGAVIVAIWVAAVGWFVVTASAADEDAVRAEESLGGLTVGEVMEPAEPAVPEYLTPVAALRRMVAARRPATPVVDVDGRPVGLVTVEALDRLAGATVPAGRVPPRVRDVTRRLAAEQVVTADQPLLEVLARAGGRSLVVVRGGVAVGLVTPDDVTWAKRRASSDRLAAGTRRP